MATNKPQHEYMKTALRLPSPLHAQLHEAAVASGRSYNAEIVSRLELSFTGDPSQTLDTKLKIGWLESRISALRGMRSNESLQRTMLLERIRRLESEGAKRDVLDQLTHELGEIVIRETDLRSEYEALFVELDRLRGEDRPTPDPDLD
jgi:hypothetical protein